MKKIIQYEQPIMYKPVFDALPENLQRIIGKIPYKVLKNMEEIRIREARPLIVSSSGINNFVCSDGRLTNNNKEAYIVCEEDTKKILQLISEYSIYAFQEELCNGYITLKGGYRVGLAGKAVLENCKIKTLKYIKSFNIRINRQVMGAGDKVLPYITKNGELFHTLILSPPQMGKTTLIRDLVRQLSDGFPGFKGVKVGVVDERSEIAGCYKGVPQNNTGIQTDILDACPKALGIMMLIRSMSPEIIVTDEIGREEDAVAVEEAINAGIKIITTAHSKDIDDAMNRPILSQLIKNKTFERIIVLGNKLGVGTLEKVYEGYTLNNILKQPVR